MGFYSVQCPGTSEICSELCSYRTCSDALLVYEESRKVPSEFSCEAENLFTQSDSETISTKEKVGGIIT